MPKTKIPIHFSTMIFKFWKWEIKEILEATSLIHLVLYFTSLPNWFFIVNFLLWRLAYDFGIGYLLHKQSTDFTFVSFYKKYLSFDKETNPQMYRIMNTLLKNDIEDDYEIKVK